jgi:RNA polymerase sigma-70 factor (ECF subfamily)
MVSRVRFEELYREHAGAVLAYARRRTTHAAADDVVAEVFLIAWRRLDGVPDEPLPWLLGVARRVLANERRGEHRGAALLDRIRVDQSTAGRSASEGDAASPAVRALWSLSGPDQELLMLIAWDGLTRAQAARALGISTGTLAVRLHRARRRLARARADAAIANPAADRSSAMEVTQ